MRWLGLVILCAVLTTIVADPDPKKYKSEVKPKIKDNNTDLTDDERKFLREVEAKFGIKSDVPVNNQSSDDSAEEDEDETSKPSPTLSESPFPAVIAIEIVNDTDSKDAPTKGKRTIDANLGYGYRTNNGYAYTYLGKSGQQQGKFMIYPYSQEDIPPASGSSSHQGYPQQSGLTTKISPNVEITPSQAYELVPAKEESPTSYNYEKPAVQLNTKYENVQSIESPPPPYPHSSGGAPSSTLYTTYNGQQFSSLSSQFPKIMSNYLVDPKQLLNNPTYQSVGLTQDHLRPHGANLQQRVVPVLVLKIPSSYIKDPSAELYANLPKNYPLSQYLNSVNLQELVNQYFKKIGYTHAPKLMAFPTTSLSAHNTMHSGNVASSISGYQPQHYASPHVQPSYTHADYSGVQYSAVQPVMAKYPSGYTRQQYYVMRPQPLYQQPLQQQHYVYRYKYVPQAPAQTQAYYTQNQYRNQPHYEHQSQHQQEHQQHEPEQQHEEHQEQEEEHVSEQHSAEQDTSSHIGYSQQPSNDQEHGAPVQYEHIAHENAPSSEEHEEVYHQPISYNSVTTAAPSYEHTNEISNHEYRPSEASASHGSSPSVQVDYEQDIEKDTVAVYPRGQTGHKANAHQYVYQNIHNGHSGSDSLILHENYPSKDHTIATVLPLSYKKQQNSEPIQSVSYVTPIPTMKFHSQYRVMVPQTVLRRPTSEKVSYVNSHSISSAYSNLAAASQYNPESEYSSGSHYFPSLGKQKTSSYIRNYRANPKRMAKAENKSDSTAASSKIESSENKKSA